MGSVEGFKTPKELWVLESRGSSCGLLWEESMVPAREPDSGMLLKNAVEKSLLLRRTKSATEIRYHLKFFIHSNTSLGPKVMYFHGRKF